MRQGGRIELTGDNLRQGMDGPYQVAIKFAQPDHFIKRNQAGKKAGIYALGEEQQGIQEGDFTPVPGSIGIEFVHYRKNNAKLRPIVQEQGNNKYEKAGPVIHFGLYGCFY